jgi:Ran GTPase-activating protein (RanGAP) involved in mRNA processing and transport
MSGGKQAAQYTGKKPDEGSVATSRDTAAAENEVHSSGHTHRKSMRLKDMSAVKQDGGREETENGKQPAAQKKRTCTTRQATQTQPLLLSADAPFPAALEAILGEDRCRTWAAGRTIMLRRTSKRVKEVVDKMLLPAVVRLSRSFWDDARNGTAAEKLQLVMRQLTLMTGWCRITTLELQECDMEGQDAESLAGVLGQCQELVHLDLYSNDIGEAGAERLAEVLGQCTALAHLDLGNNHIGPAGAESLAGVLAQCTALVHLNLCENGIEEAVAEILAGVLAQCPALASLDLCYNYIGPGGAESLAGVLGQCTALAHLNLWSNEIGTVGKGRLRASWRGQSSGLVL